MKYSFDPSFSSGLVIDITAPNGTKIRLDGSVEELESAAVNKLIDALDLAAPVEVKSLIGQATTDVRVVSSETGMVVQGSVTGVDPASRGPKGYRAAYEMYMAEADHKPTTKRTYKSRLEFAESFFGEKLGERSVVAIDQPWVYEYAKRVKSEIANPRTASLYLTTLAGMLNWFRQRYTSNFVPITTQSFLSKDQIKPAADERDPFELEEIKALFSNAKRYRVQCPHKYWVTVAVPFLGCRIEELAQLELPADLKHDAGSNIWYISLNEHPDQDGVVRKSLKKLASWRLVPIHSALVEHGFVKFLKSQVGRKEESKRPFEKCWRPYVPQDSDGQKWSHYITNWGGRELKKVANQPASTGKVFDISRKTYFHSLRHTFKQTLDRAGVSREISEALSGRQYGGTDEERYRKLQKDFKTLSEKGVEIGLRDLVDLLRFA